MYTEYVHWIPRPCDAWTILVDFSWRVFSGDPAQNSWLYRVSTAWWCYRPTCTVRSKSLLCGNYWLQAFTTANAWPTAFSLAYMYWLDFRDFTLTWGSPYLSHLWPLTAPHSNPSIPQFPFYIVLFVNCLATTDWPRLSVTGIHKMVLAFYLYKKTGLTTLYTTVFWLIKLKMHLYSGHTCCN